jgi:hypothetical protein
MVLIIATCQIRNRHLPRVKLLESVSRSLVHAALERCLERVLIRGAPGSLLAFYVGDFAWWMFRRLAMR